ncbi:hypothetical protein SAMD00023353_1500180 [Rosellinia necatrix]|uniref:Uncharacterized protein n=1 Tax=Rosellinia necatrix TaxID=77044 RepID=A0A1W2TJ30_ROSNE|nr:hypothetical protein SAMD00023353_1500180 [Rosellinia necatrix]
MHFRTVALASAIAAVTGALETHGGFQYETRFAPNASPETRDIKDAYETAAAQQAYSRLREQIEATGIASQCLTGPEGAQPADLYALKDCIVAEDEHNLFALLAEDIEESNAFWAQVVGESTTDRTKWVPARAYTKGYFNGSLTATQFAAWTLSSAADQANLRANPEHYYKETALDAATGAQSSEIFEGWGGVLSRFGTKRTNFTVPAFVTPQYGTADTPAAWDIGAGFALPLQRVGPKALTSGGRQTFGVLHIAVRDFAAGEGSTGQSGIEVYSAVWYPPWDQADEADRAEFVGNYLADEAHHMVVEVVNLTLQANKDCKSGSCVIPFPV